MKNTRSLQINERIKRYLLLFLFLPFIASCISLIFWEAELVYSLPTPVPTNYNPLKVGEPVDFKNKIAFNSKQPLLIHFYNPDCPCSKFNVPHLKSLIKKYSSEVQFIIVVISKKKSNYTIDQIRAQFKTKIPVYFDESIAKMCGVYSTPQAVIIDRNQNLYYRGNYNQSRYCTNIKSNYVDIALNALIKNKSSFQLDSFATKAYGCELPNCKK